MLRTFFFALLSLFVLSVSAIPASNEQVALVTSDPHATYSWSWSDCGQLTDIVQIKSLTLSPDPPKPGENLTVHATGYVEQTIVNGAWADVTVKIGMIKLLTKEFDICKEANANVSLQCPVEPGDHDVRHTISLPRQIPPGKFVVEVHAYNADEANLLCAKINIDFSPTFSAGLLRSS